MRRMYGPDTAAASRLVGVVLIAWGLHKLNYPWLRPVEWFAPLGFLLADFLAMLAAAGLLLVTAGRLRSIADQAARFRAQVDATASGDDEAMHYDADYIRELEVGLDRKRVV